MPLRECRCSDTRGFTLTDLVITLAVISIVATLAFPYFQTFLRAARVKAGAQELSAIIGGARQLAIARNTLVCVVLEANQAKYMLNTSAGCTGGAAYTGPITRSDGSIPLTNAMQISGTTANVVFTSLGSASTAGTYTVRDPSTNQTLNVVVAASGRVTIQ